MMAKHNIKPMGPESTDESIVMKSTLLCESKEKERVEREKYFFKNLIYYCYYFFFYNKVFRFRREAHKTVQ